MNTIKINEELSRIKLLFGNDLLYGNINNVIQEQRFVDWLNKLKKSSKTLSNVVTNLEKNLTARVSEFKNYTITSGAHLLDHLTTFKNDIYKKIYSSNECDNMEKIARKTFSDGDGDYMFSKVDGNYVFQRIPEDMRGEFFYWYKSKFPDKFAKYMAILKKEGQSINFKDATGTEVTPNVKPVDPQVEPTNVKKPKVRVDENGNFLDFDSDNNPLDMDGNKVDLSETTEGVGFKRKDITWKDRYDPEIDAGGTPEWKFDDVVEENEGKKFIGQMERTDIPQSQKDAYRKNWFTYIFQRLFPRATEFYNLLFRSFNYDDTVKKFNDALDFQINKALKGFKLDQEYLYRAAFNDAFTDFFRSLDSDPQLKLLSFEECWNMMVTNLKDEKWYKDLDYESRGIIDDHLTSLREEAAIAKVEALGDKSILGMGEPTIDDYIKKTDSDRGFTAKFLNFWYRCIKEFWGTVKIDLGPKIVGGTLSLLVNSLRFIFNIIFRGSWLNAKYMRLQLAQSGRFRPFSWQRYVAVMAYQFIGKSLITSVGVFFLAFIRNNITKYAASKGFGYDSWQRAEGDIGFQDAIKTALSYFFKGPLALFDGADESALPYVARFFPGYVDDFYLYIYLSSIEEQQAAKDALKENTDKFINNENLDGKQAKYAVKEIQRKNAAKDRLADVRATLEEWPTWSPPKREDLKDIALYLSQNVFMNDDKIDSDEELNREGFLLYQIDPFFIYDNKRYHVQLKKKGGPDIVNNENKIIPYKEWLDSVKDEIYEKLQKKTEESENTGKIDKIKQKGKNIIQNLKNVNDSIYNRNNLIMESTPRTKFGEDNFKHWKDTFVFKAEDEKNPGQFKQVKINMEDVMDRINHYRKKYDEDDAFVRAVLDTHDNVVKVMYTKDLADISESVRPRGLALVLRENRGELEIFSVSRPANGNWFLVKGDYTPSQLANMDLEKKEPEDKEPEKLTKTEDDLKKKEEESITLLKRNEKEGLVDLPRKVKQKLKEKISKGWTTEEPPSYLMDFYTTSEVNSVFNDPIEIFKLDPSPSYFATVVKNSARVTPKRGFCRSLYMASRNEELNERQRKTISHILTRCKAKLAGKFGVASF